MSTHNGTTPVDDEGLPLVDGLPALVEELRAAIKGDEGVSIAGDNPLDTLRKWLEERGSGDSWPKEVEDARNQLHPRYREAIVDPSLGILGDSGKAGLDECLRRDPDEPEAAQRQKRMVTDIAGAMVQQVKAKQNEKSKENRKLLEATVAFREVVMDLYDGFMDAEDRIGVNPPQHSVFPPQVYWDRIGYERTPHTWTVEDTRAFGLKAGVVSLPWSCRRKGLLAWAMLAHETAGHDILDADDGLREDLRDAVARALHENHLDDDLIYYWSSRIDEAASDVLGILNTGPAAGIGLIGYLRALAASDGAAPRLGTKGKLLVSYPVDALRGYLAAATVGLLSFHGAGVWAERLFKLTEEDQDHIAITMGDKILGGAKGKAELSARIVAETLVRAKVPSLENHSLGEIQDWRQQDELLVEELRPRLEAGKALPKLYWPDGRQRRLYAAHIVAAAVTKAVFEKDEDLVKIFKWMRVALMKLHDERRSWDHSYPGKDREVELAGKHVSDS